MQSRCCRTTTARPVIRTFATSGGGTRAAPAPRTATGRTATLRTRFTGTSVGIRLDGGTQLIVSIDGEKDRVVNAGPGVTALNAAPLKPGLHTLLVGSAGQNYEVGFQGLTLDPGGHTVAALPHPLIEFVGDSITTIFSDGNYSWITGADLGCDHTQISFSGVALTSGYGCLADKTGLNLQYFRLKNFNHLTDAPPLPWNFSAYTPKIVVINLGQNDQCGSEPDLTMTASMEDFVRAIRAKFPVAQIVVMRPFGGPFAADESAAVQELNAGGDSHVHYVDTTGVAGPQDGLCRWRPSQSCGAGKSGAAPDPHPATSVGPPSVRSLPGEMHPVLPL